MKHQFLSRLFLILALASVANGEECARQDLDLFSAARFGCVEQIKNLVKAGAKVDDVDRFGDSPLMWAALYRQFPAIQTLVALKANVNLQSSGGDSVLFSAIRGTCGDKKEPELLPIFDFLLASKANIQIVNSYGETPLHRAAGSCSEVVTKYFLDHGSAVNALDGAGATPLIHAIRADSATNAFEIFKFNPDVNLGTKKPLVEAAGRDAVQVVDELLRRGADIKALSLYDYESVPALTAAAMKGSLKALATLIEHGAPLDQLSERSQSSLCYAMGSKKFEAARLLLNKGANPNIVSDRCNYLIQAIDSDQLDLVKLLLLKNLKFTDGQGYQVPPLKYAVQKDSAELADLMKARGAFVDVPDRNEQTPLFFVKSLEMATRLVNWKANVNAADQHGDRPIFVITSAPIVEFLLQHGADGRLRNEAGETVLCYLQNPDKAEKVLATGLDPRVVNPKNGEGPLHRVMDPEVAKVMIRYGADVNAADRSGRTAMFNPYAKGAILRLFVDAGANLNVIDKDGCSFLSYQAQNRTLPSYGDLLYYLDHKLDPNLRFKECTRYGNDNDLVMSFLIYMYRFQNTVDALQLLVDRGARVQDLDSKGRSILFHEPAVQAYGNTAAWQMLSFILTQGLNVNIRDPEGYTPLSYHLRWQKNDYYDKLNGWHVVAAELLGAAGADAKIFPAGQNGPLLEVLSFRGGQPALVVRIVNRLLWTAGADPNANTAAGWSALHLALKNYTSEGAATLLARDLLRAGALVNDKNPEGKTALQISREQKNEALERVLIEHGAQEPSLQ